LASCEKTFEQQDSNLFESEKSDWSRPQKRCSILNEKEDIMTKNAIKTEITLLLFVLTILQIYEFLKKKDKLL
jgi:hypothetical protein